MTEPGLPRTGRRAARPTPLARAWRGLYGFGYVLLEALTRLLFRPLFLVRRVGKAPRLPRGGAVLCPNHRSYLDPPLVQTVVPRRVTFVMTDDFYRVAGARWFFRLVGAIPVSSGRMSWRSLRRTAALVRLGATAVVFPEGRISRDGSLSRAQRGVSVLARRSRAPVIPVAIDGSQRAWPAGARWMRRADVRIAFGEPLRWEGEPTREREQAFADRVLAAAGDLLASMPPARS